MNTITYSLCQKSVIGPVMWIASLCVFPPLFSDKSIDLSSAGSMISVPFHVPVEKSYPLSLGFEFSSHQARLSDDIVGDRYSDDCLGGARYEDIPEIRRAGLGRPIPIKVVILKATDRSIVLERTIISLCITSHGEKDKDRTIGYLQLPIGDYIAEVTNLEAQPGLDNVKTTISIYGGRGK